MKAFYSAILLSLLAFAAPAVADKICVKGSNPSGKTVQLKRSVVASSARCPRGSIEIFDTNTLVQSNTITTAAIADGSVTEGKIADNAVTSAKIADGAIQGIDVASNAISADKIIGGAIDSSKISSAGAGAGAVLTSNGSGGADFMSLSEATLPATAALLNRSPQTFTGANRFPTLEVFTDNGGVQTAPLGELNRDNIGFAWARITAGGAIDSDYNIASVTRVSAGRYSIQLAVSAQSGFSLIPAVTPEVDPDGANVVPTGVNALRIAVSNQVAAGNTFEVFMYNGAGNLVDNDFQFVVFGR